MTLGCDEKRRQSYAALPSKLGLVIDDVTMGLNRSTKLGLDICYMCNFQEYLPAMCLAA